jgi:hypothetical protein
MIRTYLAVGVAALGFSLSAAGCSASGGDEPPVERLPPSDGGALGGVAGAGAVSSSGATHEAGHAGKSSDGGAGGTSTGSFAGASSGGAGGAAGNSSSANGGKSGGSSGGASMSGGGMMTTSDDEGSSPLLPPISGTCPAFKTGTVTVGGLGGISLEVGPKAADGGGSLIFYWHGTGSTAGEYKFMMPAPVRSEILAKGGIIVSFQSSLRTGGDCSGTATFSKDDFKVADQIAACAVREHGIDPRRIYTTGCSAGGLQAGCMAELRSSYIAAAVPNSGGTVFPQPFQSKAHIPAAMTMHGGAGDRVIVAFSETSATFDKTIKEAGGFVVNCNHGGGHCGAPAPLYTAGWQFMKDHPFGASPEPYQSGLPSSFPSYCAKY